MRHINHASETMLEKLHDQYTVKTTKKSLVCFCRLYSYHVSHIMTRVQD